MRRYPGIAVHEFGCAITLKGSSPLVDEAMERLCEAKDAALDAMVQHSFHSTFHRDAPKPKCWYCSWTYRLQHFWQQLAWWGIETCNGCGEVMWKCGKSCEFWYDY